MFAIKKSPNGPLSEEDVSIESLKQLLAAILSCAQAAVRFVKVDRIDLNFFQQVFGNIYLLLASGYEFEAFASAEEFLERTNLTHHDCIMLDLRMPEMDGFELLGKLSSGEIEVPVIVVSAFDDRQSRARARSMGAKAYFRKPVDDQALIDAIQWSLREKECPEVRVTGLLMRGNEKRHEQR